MSELNGRGERTKKVSERNTQNGNGMCVYVQYLLLRIQNAHPRLHPRFQLGRDGKPKPTTTTKPCEIDGDDNNNKNAVTSLFKNRKVTSLGHSLNLQTRTHKEAAYTPSSPSAKSPLVST